MNIQLDIKFLNDLTVRGYDARLQAIEGALKILVTQGASLMAATQDVKDAMARIDSATNAIAARISDLISKLGTGMSQADLDAVTASLQAEAAKLESLGADPENPAPA